MSLILPTTLIPLDDLPILLGEIEKQETTPIKILIERLPVYDSIKLLRTIAWLAKIGICRGKKLYDKREALKKRSQEMDIKRQLKNY